jgi:lysophospholipase L1-like esterase
VNGGAINRPRRRRANFAALLFNGSLAAMPVGLTFARSGARAAVDYSTNAMRPESAFPTNTAALGVTPSGRVGLTLDRASAALIQPADLSASPWSTSGSVVDGGVGPDGVTHAWDVVAASGLSGPSSPSLASSAVYSFSALVRRNTALDAAEFQVELSDVVSFAMDEYWFNTGAGSLGSSWERVELYVRSASVGKITLGITGNRTVWGGATTQATTKAKVFLPQVEASEFASDFMPSGTRAGERLTLPAAAALKLVTATGRVTAFFDLSPKGHSFSYATDISIVRYDANNYASINHSTRILTVCIGGVTNTTTLPLFWNRWDRVEIWIAFGGGVASKCSYRRSGGPTVRMTWTGSALGTFPAGDLDLLCNGTSNQWSSIVHEISATEPAWTNTAATLASHTFSYFLDGDSNCRGGGPIPYALCWRNLLGAYLNPTDFPGALSVGFVDSLLDNTGTNTTTARWHGGVSGSTLTTAIVGAMGLVNQTGERDFTRLLPYYYGLTGYPDGYNLDPTLVVIAMGTNDGGTRATFLNTMQRLVMKTLHLRPNVRFVFVTPPFVNDATATYVGQEAVVATHADAINLDLPAWLDAIGVPYAIADTRGAGGPTHAAGDFSDGLHPNTQGHAKMYAVIQPKVVQMLSVGI